MGKKTFQKRFTITKTGKLIRRHSNLGHNKAKKNNKTKRRNKRPIVAHKNNKQILHHLH